MDDLARTVLARLPLAEAVLLVWSWIAEEGFLQGLFAQHRGRCYDKALSFPVLVQLIADALLEDGGSARQAFERADEAGQLPASIQAAYKKLGRLPLPLSMAFLAGCTDRLHALFPDVAAVPRPACLAHLAIVVLDGKAIKRVAKRLKPLRGAAGGVLGGRALVALELHTGLARAMQADADGEANDVRFVPALLPGVRQRLGGLRLWVADRQFCSLVCLAEFVAAWDHFLVRYHKNVLFQRDPARAVGSGQDAAGRCWTEEWGWLGRPGHRQRRYVRRIHLERPGEEAVVLVTDLLDGDRYPATDLLAVYLCRWGIERVFQQVTEVFGLRALIGSTPEATVFQFAFCLVLYNLIQVVRAHVAAAQQRPPATLSTAKLFEDVTRQLIAWREVVDPAATVACFPAALPGEAVRQRLATLLAAVWTERWIKAPSRKRRQATPRGKRTHGSVYRILQEHRRQQRLRQNT
jgi:Transposase DDE domain